MVFVQWALFHPFIVFGCFMLLQLYNELFPLKWIDFIALLITLFICNWLDSPCCFSILKLLFNYGSHVVTGPLKNGLGIWKVYHGSYGFYLQRVEDVVRYIEMADTVCNSASKTIGRTWSKLLETLELNEIPFQIFVFFEILNPHAILEFR